MASSTLKTQFNPYIAQLGMPSKGMLSAFGDAADEYELDKRKDILFGIQEKQGNLSNEKTAFDLEQAKVRAPFENESKALDVQNKRFEVNELNPLKKTTEQNRADESKQKLEQAKYDTTNKRIESENKQKTMTADINYKNALIDQLNSNTAYKALEESEKIKVGTLYASIKDLDSDGKISPEEYAQHEQDVINGKITLFDPITKKSRQTDANDARLFAIARDTHLKNSSDLAYKESQTQKNKEANLGLDALTKKVEKMKESGTALAKEFGYEDWSHLGKVDVSKLTQEQQAKFQAFGSLYLAALGEKDTEIKKKAADITNNISMLKSSTIATQSMLNGGNNVQFFDKALIDVGQYIGVPFDKELAKRNKEFQLALNTQLRMMSGTAVSANEYARFQRASSNLYRTNQDMYIALRTLAEKQNNELQGLEMGIGAVPMNAKYGILMQNSRQLNALFENASAQSAEELKPQLKGRNQPSASKPSINLIDPKYF